MAKIAKFHTCAKKFENWVDLCSGKVLKLKVTKREIILWNHLEMVNGYLQWWLLVPPPSLIRVKTLRTLLKIFLEPVNLTKFFTHFCVKLTFLPIFVKKTLFYILFKTLRIFLKISFLLLIKRKYLVIRKMGKKVNFLELYLYFFLTCYMNLY